MYHFGNLPVFEIVFALSILLYHHCCVTSFVAIPMLYRNWHCFAEILSLGCVLVKRQNSIDLG